MIAQMIASDSLCIPCSCASALTADTLPIHGCRSPDRATPRSASNDRATEAADIDDTAHRIAVGAAARPLFGTWRTKLTATTTRAAFKSTAGCCGYEHVPRAPAPGRMIPARQSAQSAAPIEEFEIMSTRTLETQDQGSLRVDGDLAINPSRDAPQPAFEPNGTVYRSLAAINATWIGLASNLLKENFRLPRRLAACTSASAMLSAYGEYCRMVVQQYQTAMGELQQIALNLAGDGPAAGFIPVKILGSQHADRARSSKRATGSDLQ